MGTHHRQDYFGPYRLVRPQSAVHGLERWVVLDEQTNTNHMLYRFAPTHDAAARRLFGAVHTLSSVHHAHTLRLESVSFDESDRLCVITPYTGNQDGLVTLSDLLESRDGKLGAVESIRCLTHLLEASAEGAACNIVHGPLRTDEILVDRCGSAQIELYGLHAALNHQSFTADLITDEVRSIVKIGYKLLVGLEPGPADRLAPTRIVKKLDRLWDKWFAIGLDPVDGFVSASDALAKLPTAQGAVDALASHHTARPQVQFGSMLRRFRPVGTRARRL